MDELDDAWFQMLVAAGEKASLEGRGDVAEYLRLKATNDVIRATGVKWLLDAFLDAAFRDRSATIRAERHEGHSFAYGTATMAGSLVTLRLGVRCLSIEAGWVRTPSHGIMRGAALARANVLHFGRKRDDQHLKLVRGTGLPEWVDEAGAKFQMEDAAGHVRRLIED